MDARLATKPRLSVVLVFAAAAIIGCGGGDDKRSATSTASSSQERPTSMGRLSLRADPSRLKYDKSVLAARPGKVTIVLTNPSSVPHDVALDGQNVRSKSEIVSEGGTSIVTADLAPGTYTFYCTVGAHRQAGMSGTLTVK